MSESTIMQERNRKYYEAAGKFPKPIRLCFFTGARSEDVSCLHEKGSKEEKAWMAGRAFAEKHWRAQPAE